MMKVIMRWQRQEEDRDSTWQRAMYGKYTSKRYGHNRSKDEKEKVMGKAKSFIESSISDKEAYLLKDSQEFMNESYRRKLQRMILESKIKLERAYGKEKTR